MGICYSTTATAGDGDGRRDRKDGGDKDGESERWWKSKSGRKIRSKSADLIFKFGGGGGGKGATAEARGLYQVSGRLSGNGSSGIASLHTQQGKKGTNQDAMIVWEKFNSTKDAVFCGVFDGHGPYGHMVARKVRDSLPVLLSTHWSTNFDREKVNANGNAHEEEEDDDDNWSEELEIGEKERVPEKYFPLKKSILKSFSLMDMELKMHPSIDCFCSGSTAVALIKQGQDLIIGNLGDSRAVLATRDDNNNLIAVQLTVDLKPNLPREAARIQQFKGRVFALQDEPEVARVWLPNSDSPGLAMARAFGDFCLKDFGLISVPDIYYHRITDKDKFVILATDGVWDVLSNKEAVDIVAAAPSRSTASRALVDCATRAWRLKYPTSKNDDCAAVCLFLDPNKPGTVVTVPVSECSRTDTETPASVLQHSDNTKEPYTTGTVPPPDDGTVPVLECSRTDTETPASVLQHSYTVPPPYDGTVPISSECSITDAETPASVLPHSDNTDKASSEITPCVENEKDVGVSKRSLAECISNAEDEEWSALEGVTRVNSLLSIPRFLTSDKKSTSSRKSGVKI